MLESFQIFEFSCRIWKWVIKQRKKKNQNTIGEIKKDLNESMVNGKKLKNKETEKRARMVENPDDAAAVICHCEELIRSKQ